MPKTEHVQPLIMRENKEMKMNGHVISALLHMQIVHARNVRLRNIPVTEYQHYMQENMRKMTRELTA